MKGRLAPLAILSLCTFAALLVAAATVVVAISQPWLGLNLQADAEPGVRIASTASSGPSANLAPGSRLIAIDDGAGANLALERFDIVEEPDIAETYADLDRFLARQDVIAGILGSGLVYLTLDSGERLAIAPRPLRPITSLPPMFWTLLLIGLAGTVIGGWTLAFRPDDPGARCLAACTAALLLSCYPPAIYMHRELALPEPLFRVLSSINIFGSLGFVLGLLTLFLVYPNRLVRNGGLLVPAVVVLAVWCADAFRLGLSGPGEGRYLPTAIIILAVLVAAGFQYWKARGDPRTRAAVLWFALSIAAAAGVFAIVFALPVLAGQGEDVPSSLGYILALPVFAGIAVGVARYRLFELELWTFRILFYLVGAAALVGVDLILVSLLTLDQIEALGLSLGLVALLYLPLRDAVARWVLAKEPDRGRLVQPVVEAALAPAGRERNERWRKVLADAFEPLQLERLEGAPYTPELAQEGLALLIPGHADLSPLRLAYAYGGRRLFSPRDAELATQLRDLLIHSIDSRNAYERGVANERLRIARDMHDNIGARLLSALHSSDSTRKDNMVRETLMDLRNILNNFTGTAQSLDEAIAELRLETAERLSEAGLELRWSVDPGSAEDMIPAGAIHALRSILREAVSNAIRHSGARIVSVEIARRSDRLALSVTDDGHGPNDNANSGGTGLANMRKRLAALDGHLDVETAGPGLRLVAEFSCSDAVPS